MTTQLLIGLLKMIEKWVNKIENVRGWPSEEPSLRQSIRLVRDFRDKHHDPILLYIRRICWQRDPCNQLAFTWILPRFKGKESKKRKTMMDISIDVQQIPEKRGRWSQKFSRLQEHEDRSVGFENNVEISERREAKGHVRLAKFYLGCILLSSYF